MTAAHELPLTVSQDLHHWHLGKGLVGRRGKELYSERRSKGECHGDGSHVDRVLRLQACRTERLAAFVLDADVDVSRAAPPPSDRCPIQSYLLSGLLRTASGRMVDCGEGQFWTDHASRGVVGVDATARFSSIL